MLIRSSLLSSIAIKSLETSWATVVACHLTGGVGSIGLGREGQGIVGISSSASITDVWSES